MRRRGDARRGATMRNLNDAGRGEAGRRVGRRVRQQTENQRGESRGDPLFYCKSVTQLAMIRGRIPARFCLVTGP